MYSDDEFRSKVVCIFEQNASPQNMDFGHIATG